jgi:hypothetical protein
MNRKRHSEDDKEEEEEEEEDEEESTQDDDEEEDGMDVSNLVQLLSGERKYDAVWMKDLLFDMFPALHEYHYELVERKYGDNTYYYMCERHSTENT